MEQQEFDRMFDCFSPAEAVLARRLIAELEKLRTQHQMRRGDEELLLNFLGACADGKAPKLMLTGEHGTGKTRIARLLKRAGTADMVVIDCEPYTSDSPHGIDADFVRAALRQERYPVVVVSTLGEFEGCTELRLGRGKGDWLEYDMPRGFYACVKELMNKK